MKKIVIIGASGHGKVVAAIARQNRYDDIVFLDDDINIKILDDYDVVGTTEDIVRFINKDVDFFVAIGDSYTRQRFQEKLESMNCSIATLIHPNATIECGVKVGSGTVVMAGSVINPGTSIGKGCIVNTCSSIDHDNKIGNFCHISVGAHTAGTVIIGERCWLGIGAVISNNIKICDDVFVGAGAVIVKDINNQGKYYGNPGTFRGI